jgi:hypothetical protein
MPTPAAESGKPMTPERLNELEALAERPLDGWVVLELVAEVRRLRDGIENLHDRWYEGEQMDVGTLLRALLAVNGEPCSPSTATATHTPTQIGKTMSNWTDKPCDYAPEHAPHLWGGTVEQTSGSITYVSQIFFRCHGNKRTDNTTDRT